MGFLDRLLGREPRDRTGSDRSGTYRTGPAPSAHSDRPYGYQPEDAPAYGSAATSGRSTDEVAVERYRYLLRTAPPDAVEAAHAEAFAQLTPEQRRQVLTQLANEVPESERVSPDDPRALARMATRAEMRRPGTLLSTFGGQGGTRSGLPGGQGGPGFGSMVGGSLLGTIAGVVIGSAIADAMFGPEFGDPSQEFTGAEGDVGAEADPGTDPGADEGAGDVGAEGDGGGFFGGDFGGGDFGGDFGGGDF